MEFEVPTIIIGILSFGFAIFLGRKIHPFFYPERKVLRDSFEAGVRLDRKFGNYDGRRCIRINKRRRFHDHCSVCIFWLILWASICANKSNRVFILNLN